MIHEFWFGTLDARGRVASDRSERWFTVDPEFDREVRIHFESDLRTAAAGRRVRWEDDPRGVLALVLLFDQFPRNTYRGTPRAFVFDAHAYRCMEQAVSRGLDKQLWPVERAFLNMPLLHSEDVAAQEQAVERFAELADAADGGQQDLFGEFTRKAREHREIIRTFARFPYRNDILGRESSAAERAFLAKGGGRQLGVGD